MEYRQFATSEGTIHYWINICNPDGKWIVFLPGLTADHHLFDKQIEYFVGKYNLFVWDAPAHGLSRPFNLIFSMQDIAQYLYKIFRTESITKPVFIGQSLGGYIAQVYMNLYPNVVAGFISIDSCPLSRRYYSWWELALLKRTKRMYMSIPWKFLLRWGIHGTSETPYGRQLMEKTWAIYEKAEYCKLADHGFKIFAEAVEAQNEYPITCPTLLLCGEKDHAGSAKRYNCRWAKNEGYKLVWIKNAGHNSNADAPKQVNQQIETFVAESTD